MPRIKRKNGFDPPVKELIPIYIDSAFPHVNLHAHRRGSRVQSFTNLFEYIIGFLPFGGRNSRCQRIDSLCARHQMALSVAGSENSNERAAGEKTVALHLRQPDRKKYEISISRYGIHPHARRLRSRPKAARISGCIRRGTISAGPSVQRSAPRANNQTEEYRKWMTTPMTKHRSEEK